MEPMNEKELARIGKNAYMREYRRRNKDKKREYDMRYWAKVGRRIMQGACDCGNDCGEKCNVKEAKN